MQIDFQKFSNQRNFGIELEIGNEVALNTIATVIKQTSSYPLRSNLYNRSVNNNCWDLKLDGSCGRFTDDYGINEGGFEVASFKASGMKQLRHIGKIANKMKKIGVKTNNNCGLHVHVDISDFTEEDAGKLVAAWLCVEKTLLAASPTRRRCNKYCLPLRNFNNSTSDYLKSDGSGLDYLKVWEHFKPSSTNPHNNVHRRRTMNLLNYYRFKKIKNYKRSTVEFRFPEGTLVEANVTNWTKLLVNFVSGIKNLHYDLNFSKKHSLHDVLFILGLGHNDQIFTILSDALRDAKIWLLRRLLRYSYDCYMDYSFDFEQMRAQSCDILKKMGEKCVLQ